MRPQAIVLEVDPWGGGDRVMIYCGKMLCLTGECPKLPAVRAIEGAFVRHSIGSGQALQATGGREGKWLSALENGF